MMEITQFQMKVFVALFFAAFETSSGCNQVAAQEDEYSSGGGIKHKKDMTSHGRYSCCCLAMVINYHALGDVYSACLISHVQPFQTLVLLFARKLYFQHIKTSYALSIFPYIYSLILIFSTFTLLRTVFQITKHSCQ
jgi:hypothetical protein